MASALDFPEKYLMDVAGFQSWVQRSCPLALASDNEKDPIEKQSLDADSVHAPFTDESCYRTLKVESTECSHRKGRP